jgi:hypothetical protein
MLVWEHLVLTPLLLGPNMPLRCITNTLAVQPQHQQRVLEAAHCHYFTRAVQVRRPAAFSITCIAIPVGTQPKYLCSFELWA